MSDPDTTAQGRLALGTLPSSPPSSPSSAICSPHTSPNRRPKRDGEGTLGLGEDANDVPEEGEDKENHHLRSPFVAPAPAPATTAPPPSASRVAQHQDPSGNENISDKKLSGAQPMSVPRRHTSTSERHFPRTIAGARVGGGGPRNGGTAPGRAAGAFNKKRSGVVTSVETQGSTTGLGVPNSHPKRSRDAHCFIRAAAKKKTEELETEATRILEEQQVHFKGVSELIYRISEYLPAERMRRRGPCSPLVAWSQVNGKFRNAILFDNHAIPRTLVEKRQGQITLAASHWLCFDRRTGSVKATAMRSTPMRGRSPPSPACVLAKRFNALLSAVKGDHHDLVHRLLCYQDLGYTLQRDFWMKILEVTVRSGTSSDTMVKCVFGAFKRSGVPVNIFEFNGNSTLRAQLLLEQGADVNGQDHLGRTLAHIAGTVEMLRWALMNGANPNAVDKDGWTVAMFQSSDVKRLNLLVEFGADLKMRDAQGRTLAHHFIQFGEPAYAVDDITSLLKLEPALLKCDLGEQSLWQVADQRIESEKKQQAASTWEIPEGIKNRCSRDNNDLTLLRHFLKKKAAVAATASSRGVDATSTAPPSATNTALPCPPTAGGTTPMAGGENASQKKGKVWSESKEKNGTTTNHKKMMTSIKKTK